MNTIISDRNDANRVCPLCGIDMRVPFARLRETPPCSSCTQLLWWFKNALHQHSAIRSELSFLGEVSLDRNSVVESVLHLEELLGIVLPDEEAQQCRTLADVIAYLSREHRE